MHKESIVFDYIAGSKTLTRAIFYHTTYILTFISSQINPESYKRKHHMWKLARVRTTLYRNITKLTLLVVTMCGSDQTTPFHFPMSLSRSTTISVKKRYANLCIFQPFLTLYYIHCTTHYMMHTN